MISIQSKIFKIIKALEVKGYIYLINNEQVFSFKSNKTFNLIKLFYLMPVEQYNKLYPENKKDANKKLVKVEIIKSFKKQDILFKLIDIYRQVGE
ncbi:hypothetical protein [Clostridium rectalis]|uniref:hypothetical protein n=1 Tax=Clostridium rectalis TaxID=2040295 RepID=UPI000F6312B4|nr:hypothetical protein [Clostridium rectalis]